MGQQSSFGNGARRKSNLLCEIAGMIIGMECQTGNSVGVELSLFTAMNRCSSTFIRRKALCKYQAYSVFPP